MRWVAFVLVGLVLAGVGLVAVIQEREDDQDLVVIGEYAVPWRLVDVGPGGKMLKLVHNGGGCPKAPARAVVREARSFVRIEVRRPKLAPAKPSAQVACSLVLRLHRITARLKSPVGGRRVEGDGTITTRYAWSRAHERRGRVVVGVPRVVGLSAGDAVELLGYQLFRSRLRGAAVGRVIAQRPRPGKLVRVNRAPAVEGVVTLTLGRFKKP